MLVKTDRDSYTRWGDTKPVRVLERLGEPFIIRRKHIVISQIEL